MKKTIKILFKDKVYEIDKSCIDFVISKLENNKLKHYSEEEIINLMEKYSLFDSYFLENINKLKG